MLEKGRDASDVQAEASRRASRSVNAAGEERVVLLPRTHTSRTRHRGNPQIQAHHAHVQAPGKHGPVAPVDLIPSRIGHYCVQTPPEKTKETSIIHRGGVRELAVAVIGGWSGD